MLPGQGRPEKTIAVVERIMSQACGGAVCLAGEDDLGGSGRSAVNRLRVLDGPAEAPASVIVKSAISGDGEMYNPDATDGPSWRLFNDWAGLQLLGEVMGSGSLAPRLYGGDRDAGVIVMEDVGSGLRLDDVLLGSDAAMAEKLLLDLAAALGRMHAATIGQHALHRRIRELLGPRQAGAFGDRYEQRNYARLAATFHDAATALGIAPRRGVDDELRILSAQLAEPGPFLAYTHRDACPDNVVWAGDRLMLLDFEFGGYGHALIDGVYGRIHFPSCWCVNRLPEHIPLLMEQRYRAALAEGCPEARDDGLFYHAVIVACATHVISRHDIPALLREDGEWGIATRRQRTLLRFDVFAHLTEEYGEMRALGATIRAMESVLHDRWSPGLAPMPHYPAFR